MAHGLRRKNLFRGCGGVGQPAKQHTAFISSTSRGSRLCHRHKVKSKNENDKILVNYSNDMINPLSLPA